MVLETKNQSEFELEEYTLEDLQDSDDAVCTKQQDEEVASSQLACEEGTTVESAYASWLAHLNYLPFPASIRSIPEELLVYIRHDYPPSAAELKRAAIVQTKEGMYAYQQSNGTFNIWYGYNIEYSTGHGTKRSERALTALNLFEHAGITLVTKSQNWSFKPFCLYFAQGRCFKGAECSYLHRVPTLFDNDQMPPKMDVFGRERPKGSHHDNIGIGSYNNANRTLLVIGFPMVANIVGYKDLEEFILTKFCIYGPVESVKCHRKRALVVIQYCFRASCEFAFVATDGQEVIVNEQTSILTVKWSENDCDRMEDIRVAKRRLGLAAKLRVNSN